MIGNMELVAGYWLLDAGCRLQAKGREQRAESKGQRAKGRGQRAGGKKVYSSEFRVQSSEFGVVELAAYTKCFTFASRAATSIFRKPPMFTVLVVMGSLMERGTLPNAA